MKTCISYGLRCKSKLRDACDRCQRDIYALAEYLGSIIIPVGFFHLVDAYALLKTCERCSVSAFISHNSTAYHDRAHSVPITAWFTASHFLAHQSPVALHW